MAINKKFIHFKRKSTFQRELDAGNILNTSMVFISDSKQFYVNGQFFSENTLFDLNQLLENVSGELSETDTTNEAVIKLYKLIQEVNEDVNNIIKLLISEIDNLRETTNERIDQTDQILATGLSQCNNTIKEHLDNKNLQHIPTGGSERQILAWKKDGEAQWEDLADILHSSDILPALTELLAYGVEWDINVADPHLTRIGNMSLHKTLPIQSQLKGCIAQANKVIYWLDENDWRFRKDAQTIAVNLTTSTETFTVPSTKGLGINQYLRSGEYLAKITAIDTEASTITVAWELPESEENPDLTTITSLEVGSRLDGYDGTVRVYCPAFYIKSQIIGDIRRVWLSTVNIDNTWTYQPEILIDAYRCTVLNTVPENMGYLSTLPVNSAISVVNTATYCRGLDNQDNLDNNLNTTPFNTALGKPATNLSRPTMRTYCRKAKSEMLSYIQYKNIFYWLWVIEYANFNSQEDYNSELTVEGYHQGGMGLGVTIAILTGFGDNHIQRGIIPCGYMNEFGNRTGIKTAILSNGKTVQVPRWRGFENPFGDLSTCLDGNIINGTSIFITDDPAKYGDDEAAMNNMRLAAKVYAGSGYIKLYDLGDEANIFPSEFGNAGTGTSYKCDYISNITSGLCTLRMSAGPGAGPQDGLGCIIRHIAVLKENSSGGFRSVSSFVSFPDNE